MLTIEVFQARHSVLYHNAIEIRRWVRERLDAGCNYLLIDLQNVAFIDSSGLGILVSTFEDVRRQGGVLALASLQSQVSMMIEVCELGDFFPTYADRQDFERAIAI
ncbi:MAG: STAS domain-containing protein [Elainellaceae cyanobacterium]